MTKIHQWLSRWTISYENIEKMWNSLRFLLAQSDLISFAVFFFVFRKMTNSKKSRNNVSHDFLYVFRQMFRNSNQSLEFFGSTFFASMIRHVIWVTLENFNIATSYVLVYSMQLLCDRCISEIILHSILKINYGFRRPPFWPQKTIYSFSRICSSAQSSTPPCTLLTLVAIWGYSCLYLVHHIMTGGHQLLYGGHRLINLGHKLIYGCLQLIIGGFQILRPPIIWKTSEKNSWQPHDNWKPPIIV